MPYADAEARRAAKRESARRRRAGESRPARRPKPELAELRYATLSELLAVLADEIDGVRASALEQAERSRLLAYLVSVASRLIEGVAIEQRLDVVERTLESVQRTGDQNVIRHPAAVAMEGDHAEKN